MKGHPGLENLFQALPLPGALTRLAQPLQGRIGSWIQSQGGRPVLHRPGQVTTSLQSVSQLEPEGGTWPEESLGPLQVTNRLTPFSSSQGLFSSLPLKLTVGREPCRRQDGARARA